MLGAIAPYTTAEIESAADLLDTIETAFCGLYGDDAIAATVEAIDKLERRGVIGEAVACLLSEIYDVPHVAALPYA